MFVIFFFFFFNDTATTEIYTLSLHDALPICPSARGVGAGSGGPHGPLPPRDHVAPPVPERRGRFDPAGDLHRARRERGRRSADREAHARRRSEEHTSELQSLAYLVCRLLLEK